MTTTTVSKNALVWVETDFDEANETAKMIFGEMIWAFVNGTDDFYSIAPVTDPILQKRLWALERNNFEIGRYADIEEAKSAASRHRLQERCMRHQ